MEDHQKFKQMEKDFKLRRQNNEDLFHIQMKWIELTSCIYSCENQVFYALKVTQ